MHVVFNDNIVLEQMPEKAITGPAIGYGDLSSHVLSRIAVNNIFPQNEYVRTTLKELIRHSLTKILCLLYHSTKLESYLLNLSRS